MSAPEPLCEVFPDDIMGVISSYLPPEVHGKLDCCSSRLLFSGFTWDCITYICQDYDQAPKRLVQRITEHHRSICSASDDCSSGLSTFDLLLPVAGQLRSLKLDLLNADDPAGHQIQLLSELDARKLEHLSICSGFMAFHAEHIAALVRLLPNLRSLRVISKCESIQTIVGSIENHCSTNKLCSLSLECTDMLDAAQLCQLVRGGVVNKFRSCLKSLDLITANANLDAAFPGLAVNDLFDYDAMDQLCRALYGVPLDRFNSNCPPYRVSWKDPFAMLVKKAKTSQLSEEQKQRIFPRVGPFFERIFFYEGTLVRQQECFRGLVKLFRGPLAQEMSKLAYLMEPIKCAFDQLETAERIDSVYHMAELYTFAYADGIEFGGRRTLDRLKDCVEKHRSLDTLLGCILRIDSVDAFIPLLQDREWLDRVGFDLRDGAHIWWFLRRMGCFNLIADYVRPCLSIDRRHSRSVLGEIYRLDDFSQHPEKRRSSTRFYDLIVNGASLEQLADLIREDTGLALPDLETDAAGLEFSHSSYLADIGEIVFRDIVRSGVDFNEISQRCDSAKQMCELPRWLDDFVSHKDASHVKFMELDEARAEMLVDAIFDGLVMAPVRRYREKIGQSTQP